MPVVIEEAVTSTVRPVPLPPLVETPVAVVYPEPPVNEEY